MISLQLFFVIHHFILYCLCSIFMLDIIFLKEMKRLTDTCVIALPIVGEFLNRIYADLATRCNCIISKV